jgi:hypothetical protein
VLSKGYVIANLLCFQLLWFGCVVGAGANGWHWVGIASVLPLTVLACFSDTRWADFLTAGVAACFGLFIDNLWVRLDILAYPGHSFAPYWIVLLWYGLGLTVNHSLVWFRDRKWLGALLVGAFAPLTYLAGERLGAVDVEQMAMTAVIALSWVLGFRLLAHWSLWLVRSESSWLEN